MLRLFKFLFTGDWHVCKYEILHDIKLYDDDDIKDKLSVGRQIISRCKICGKINSKILRS